MRAWLQDPKVVVAISLVAVAYLAWSFWPKPRNDFGQGPLLTMELSGPLVSTAVSIDTSGSVGLLDTIQWKRKANRNPFNLEVRKGDIPGWLSGQPEPVRKQPVVTKAKKKKVKPLPHLEAIALGPGGQLALIDGRWKKRGALVGKSRIESISADTVWLQTGKLRIPLTFKKGR